MKPKSALREFVQSGLRSAGLSMTFYPPPHHLSHYIKNFLEEQRINLVLDVGAYRGAYCQMLREEVGYHGRIVSFEPTPSSFQALKTAMAGDANWQGYPFGLSDADTTAVLNNYPVGEFNSLLPLRPEHAALYKTTSKPVSTETVQLRKLDSAWSEIVKDIPSPRVFLKIDTQGHDMAVVRGAEKHLQSIIGMQSELAVIEIYDGMVSMPDALKAFRQSGYLPIWFHPVNRPAAYQGASPEFDVLLMRR
jgi:FkbM family methyltransferase